MFTITTPLGVCMRAITMLSRQRLEYVCYQEAVEGMHVSYHDVVKTVFEIRVLS